MNRVIIPPTVISKIKPAEVIRRLLSNYDENRPDIPAQTVKNNTVCSLCGGTLILFPDDSEMRCDKCGGVEDLPGTLFEDNQFYNQQITCTKHKRHNTGAHCMKWMLQLQAKEGKIVPSEVIDTLDKIAIKEYTHAGTLRSMSDMKCKQVRVWLQRLKQEGFTKYNHHVPLIRKLITGRHGEPVVPPQLTTEEEQLVLNDYNQATKAFEKIVRREEVLRPLGKNAIKNNVYYPFFLLKILMRRFRRDPRLRGLIECIHLQSAGTLKKDDLFWEKICTEMGRPMDFQPTDRTILVDIV